MSHAARVGQMTYAEYLVLETTSHEKHEYLRGEILAMAGGTPQHGAVSLAFGGDLRSALRGRSCVVYNSDVRVRIQATGLTTYPDASVVCGQLITDAEDSHAITNPILVAEVLSDSTAAYDRGAKAAHYRQIPSLREYVIVDPEQRLVEVQRRNDQGTWELHEARPGQRIDLASLAVSLDVSALFEDPLATASTG